MLNIFKTKSVETHKVLNGKVVLVKQWPVKASGDNSWGRCGYDSLYK
jgi:hypothetical protein